MGKKRGAIRTKMEEDTKLVESLIKEFEVYGDLDGIQDLIPYMKTIKHLIKAYKEEKEKNNKLYNENVNLYNKKEVEVYNKGIENANSFWTSKMKELKHELEEEYISLGKTKQNKVQTQC